MCISFSLSAVYCFAVFFLTATGSVLFSYTSQNSEVGLFGFLQNPPSFFHNLGWRLLKALHFSWQWWNVGTQLLWMPLENLSSSCLWMLYLTIKICMLNGHSYKFELRYKQINGYSDFNLSTKYVFSCVCIDIVPVK